MKTGFTLAALAACATLTAVAQSFPPPPRAPQQQPAQPRAQQQPAPRAAAGQPGQGLSGFGWLADLANACWRAERAENRADVQCYTTQFNRFVRGTIKFYQGSNVVGEGDSVFSYDPGARVIVYAQWGSNGGFGLGEIAVENNELVFRTRLPDGSEAPARSVWRRVDPDSFRVVREHRADQGEGWVEDASTTYKRVAK